jgi:hypothetical protein
MNMLKLGLVLIGVFSLCGCATSKKAHAPASQDGLKMPAAPDESAEALVKLLRITANVDGSGRIILTTHSVRYEHRSWDPPKEVTFNGEAWENLASTPSGWHDFSRGLDLSRAWIVKRQGRDVIALEHTSQGCDLYLCDAPNGSADYEVTIAIPRRN